MNNNKRLTRGDFETLMKMFEKIIQNCDRATAKKILDILRDVEHTIFDFNEEHGIDQCNCPECESDRKKDAILTEEGRVKKSDLTPDEIHDLYMEVWKGTKAIRDLLTEEKQSSKDKAYIKWKKDFLKKKQKEDSEGKK